MKQFTKRAISMLLAVLMIVTMIPTFAITAFADDETIVWKFDASQVSATGNGSSFNKGSAYKVVDPSNNNSFIQGIFWNETDKNCNTSNSGYVHAEDASISGGIGSTTGFGSQKLYGNHWIFQYRYAYLAQGKNGDGNNVTDNNNCSVFALGNNGANVINITSDGNVYLNGSATKTTTIDRTKFICTDKADVRTAAFEFENGTLTFSVKGETLFTTTAINGTPDITNFFMGASTVTTAGGTMQYVGPANTGNLVHGMYLYKLIGSVVTESESNAIVKSGTLNPLKRTLITGSGSRLSSSNWNIVNDQEAGNTSAGIVKYDISDLKNTVAKSASLSFQITTAPLGDYQGLTFYWTTDSSKVEGLLNDGEQQGKISGSGDYGSGTKANQKVANTLGFNVDSNKLCSLPQSSNTANTYNIDIPNTTLQKIIDTNSSVVYIVCMQSQAGGSGSTGGWSDTIVNPTTVKLTYQSEVPDKSKEEVEAAFNAVPSSPTVKSSTLTESEDGTVKETSLTGSDVMSNVLYMYGLGGGAPYKETSDSNYFSCGMQYGSMTFLDDGETEMGAPISSFFNNHKGGFGQNRSTKPINVKVTTSPFTLNHRWHGSENSNAGYFSSTSYTMNYGQLSDNYSTSGIAQADFKDNKSYRYSNTLYVDRSNVTYGDNYRATYTSQQFYLYANSDGGNRERNVTMDSATIRVINYAPLANIIRGIKNNTLTEYKNIKESYEYNYYTGSSTVQYLNALKEICNFDPNSYFGKSTNNYDACCTEIKRLVDQYNNAVGDLKINTYTVTFKYNNGKELTKKVKRFGTVTCPNDDSPSVTSKYNADQHSITRYYWGPADKSIVKDMVYNELNEVTYYNHEWQVGAKIEATCTEDGSQAYECSVCGQTKSEVLTKTGHNWNLTAGVANYSTDTTYDSSAAYTHKVTCTKDESHKDDVACSFPAEWTVDGDIERKECSVCHGTITQPHIVGHTITFKNVDGTDIDIVTTIDGQVPNAPNLAQFTKVDAEGHHTFSWDKTLAAATEDTTYTLVENEIIPHAYSGDYTQTKAPSCSEEGIESRDCTVDSNCTFKDTRAINKLPHSFGDWIYNESVRKQHHICSVCNEDVYDECSFEITEEVKATCTENGHIVYTCLQCDGSYEEFPQALGHDDVDELPLSNVVKETCTTDGYTGDKICTKCKTVLKGGSIIPATGHTEEDTFVPATCIADGYWTSRCTVCNEDFGKIDNYYYEANTKCDSEYPTFGQGVGKGTSYTIDQAYEYTRTEEIDKIEVTFDCKIYGGVFVNGYAKALDGDGKQVYYFENTKNSAQTKSNETFTVTTKKFTLTGHVMNEGDYYVTVKSIKIYPKYPALGHDYEGGEVVEDVPSTCTTAGYTVTKCIRCDETNRVNKEIDSDNHDYSLKDVANNAGSYTWYDVCSYNNEHKAVAKTIDATAYEAAVALANADVANTAKYTETSRNALQTAINDNALDFTAESEITADDVETATANITTADKLAEGGVLVLNKYTIKQHLDDDGEVTENIVKRTVDYGTSVELTLPAEYADRVVAKWTKTINAQTVPVGSTNKTITAVVNSNVEYVVFVKPEAAKPDDGEYVKVSMTNKVNKVSDTDYVKTGEQTVTMDTASVPATVTITDSDSKAVTLEAPSYSFYKVSGFLVDGKKVSEGETVTVTEDTVIKPQYTVVTRYNIVLDEGVKTKNGITGSVEAGWDEEITVTADDATENTKWLLSLDGGVNYSAVSYGKTYTFRVSQGCKIKYETEAEALPTSTLEYVSYDIYKEKTITAVGRYTLPEGYEFVEAGVIIKSATQKEGGVKITDERKDKVNNPANYTVETTSGKYVAKEFVKNTNQYTINVYASATYVDIYIGAKAYLTYKDKNGDVHTVYSDFGSFQKQA